jgi:hypothetical protein
VYESQPDFSESFPDGRWIYITPNSSSYGGFSEAEYAKLEVFWATGGWEKWAVSKNIEQENWYGKMKVSYTNSNTKFDLISMVEPPAGEDGWATYYYPTLAALKDAEDDLVEDDDDQKITFSRSR